MSVPAALRRIAIAFLALAAGASGASPALAADAQPAGATCADPAGHAGDAVLPRWDKALARVRAGQGSASLAIVGDSTDAAFGAGSGENGLTGAWTSSVAAQLAADLRTAGIPAEANSFFGDQSAYSLEAYEAPRVALGLGWGRSVVSLGGASQANSSSRAPLRFTPTEPFDRIEVWYIAGIGASTFSVSIDGGSALRESRTGALSIETAGAGAIAKADYVGLSLGGHTVSITPSGLGPVYISGVHTIRSSAPAVSVWNLASIGSKTSDWVVDAHPWSPLKALGDLPADLTIIDLGINDLTHDVPLAESQGNLQRLIGAIRRRCGDVALAVPIPIDPEIVGAPSQRRYGDMVRALATINHLLPIDLPADLGSWHDIHARGLSFDQVHLNASGYALKARFIAAAVTAERNP